LLQYYSVKYYYGIAGLAKQELKGEKEAEFVRRQGREELLWRQIKWLFRRL
jgi:hypothetical protein